MGSVAQTLYNAGYRDLVSVIPPDGELSPNSRIAEDQRGKVPGLRGMRGWYGYRWDVDYTEDLPERIDATGANIGIRGHRFPGLDLDTDDPQLSLVVLGIAKEILGPAPVRLSRGSRRLLMYRTDRPFKKRVALIEYKAQTHTVEMLADGQQYLIRGRHPSGTAYRWESFPADPTTLTPVTGEKVDAFFRTLQKRLGEKGVEVELALPGRKANGKADPIPETVAAGDRNRTMASLVGTFRARNLSREAALAAALAESEKRFEQGGGWGPEEIERIVDSVYRYEAGHDYADMPKQIAAEDEFEAEESARPKGLVIQKAGEIMKEPDEDIRWLVEGLIHGYGMSMIAAKPKVGKSTLARALAVAVARGEPFLGREVEQGPVLYLMFPGEGNKDEWRREMRMLGVEENDPLPLYHHDAIKHPSEHIIADLAQTVKAVQPRLVIVDTMQHILKAEDLNKYAEVAKRFGPIFNVGAHLLLLHHAKKGQTVDVVDASLGSTKIGGSVEVLIHLYRDYHDRQTRYFEAVGRGVEILDPQMLSLDPETHWPTVRGSKYKIKAQEVEQEVLAVLADFPAGLRKREIEDEATGRREDVRAAVDRLTRNGVLLTEQDGQKILYRVPQADDEFDPEEADDGGESERVGEGGGGEV